MREIKKFQPSGGVIQFHREALITSVTSEKSARQVIQNCTLLQVALLDKCEWTKLVLTNVVATSPQAICTLICELPVIFFL